MKKVTSIISMLLVMGAPFQNQSLWAQQSEWEGSKEVKTETVVFNSENELAQCCPPPCDPYCPPPVCAPCEPCPPPCDPCCPPPACAPRGPYCPPPCPPPCEPPCPPPCPPSCPPPANCPPPCDPCAPVCKRNSGISIWAIGIALLAVGGAAAIVVTSNNGATGSSE
jgi:hypothetical protein